MKEIESEDMNHAEYTEGLLVIDLEKLRGISNEEVMRQCKVGYNVVRGSALTKLVIPKSTIKMKVKRFLTKLIGAFIGYALAVAYFVSVGYLVYVILGFFIGEGL